MRKKGIEWDAEKMEVRKVFWRPKYGDTYFTADFSYVLGSVWAGSNSDLIELDYNNCFKTREEAQKYADEFARLLRERPL